MAHHIDVELGRFGSVGAWREGAEDGPAPSGRQELVAVPGRADDPVGRPARGRSTRTLAAGDSQRRNPASSGPPRVTRVNGGRGSRSRRTTRSGRRAVPGAGGPARRRSAAIGPSAEVAPTDPSLHAGDDPPSKNRWEDPAASQGCSEVALRCSDHDGHHPCAGEGSRRWRPRWIDPTGTRPSSRRARPDLGARPTPPSAPARATRGSDRRPSRGPRPVRASAGRAGSPPPSVRWPPCSTPGASRRSATPTATTRAAVKSATVSWKAFFFGSIDPATSSPSTSRRPRCGCRPCRAHLRLQLWSMLLPEALAGVASVLILHHLVKRWAGDTAAHLSALAFALTPVAVVMFRYNNPDALLTLLCLGGAWALWKAVETGRTRHLLVSAGAHRVGLRHQDAPGLPGAAGVHRRLPAGRAAQAWASRIWQLAPAAVTLAVAGGWWIAIVALTPAGSRPYVGSTQDNSILSLLTGYNGLSRLFGNTGGAGGAVGGAEAARAAAASASVAPRASAELFNSSLGGQVAWLIPLAVAGLAAGVWLDVTGPRTDRTRAGWLLWGGWALPARRCSACPAGSSTPTTRCSWRRRSPPWPAPAALALWRLGRTHCLMAWALPAAVVATAGWAVCCWPAPPGYDTWLAPVIVAGAALGQPDCGPEATSANEDWWSSPGRWPPSPCWPARPPTPSPPSATRHRLAGLGRSQHRRHGQRARPGGRRLAAAPPAPTPPSSRYLEAHQGSAEYLVAGTGSQTTASIIIASGKPVITIGGFNGSDPSPDPGRLRAPGGHRRGPLRAGHGGRGGFGRGWPGRRHRLGHRQPGSRATARRCPARPSAAPPPGRSTWCTHDLTTPPPHVAASAYRFGRRCRPDRAISDRTSPASPRKDLTMTDDLTPDDPLRPAHRATHRCHRPCPPDPPADVPAARTGASQPGPRADGEDPWFAPATESLNPSASKSSGGAHVGGRRRWVPRCIAAWAVGGISVASSHSSSSASTVNQGAGGAAGPGRQPAAGAATWARW